MQERSTMPKYDGAVRIPNSFATAVEFARMNNLLGLLVDADLLVRNISTV